MAITSATCKSKPIFTDIGAAIEEADFLFETTKKPHMVVQIGEIMVVVRYHSHKSKKNMYSTRVNRGVAG